MKSQSIAGTSALDQRNREIFHIQGAAPQANLKLRLAGYARVSSDSTDQLNSFSVQVRYYTRLIEENESWELIEVYADEGLTGVSTDKRDDFNRMLADCRKGKIDRIITKSTSRFARNTMDTIRVIRELKSLGVSVYFEKEGIDTQSLTSENLLTLYAMFAQNESENISKNTKKGNRMRMESGAYVSSNVPYGYRLTDSLPQIYEPEAEVVRRIFSEYLMGRGTDEIAKGLTRDGIPRKDGGLPWRHQAVLLILRNERYIGDMLLQKHYNEDAIPYKQYHNRGELPQYYVKNSHEPIVDRIQFELTNILLDERSRLMNNAPPGEYPLSRKIRCGICGTAYRRKLTNNTIYWVCRQHDRDRVQCASERITEEAVCGAFIRLYNHLKKNRDQILLPMLSQLEKLQEQKTRSNPEISTLNKQIAHLSEQNHVMNGLLSDGILDSALFISQTDELARKLRALKNIKAKLMEEIDADDTLGKTQDLLDVLTAGPEHITEMDTALFGELVEKIIVRNNVSLDFVLINGLTLTERM